MWIIMKNTVYVILKCFEDISRLWNNFQMSFIELDLPTNLFLLTKTEQVGSNLLYAINSSSLAYCRNVSLRGTAVAAYKTLRCKVSDLKWPELPIWESQGQKRTKSIDEAVICWKLSHLLAPHEGFHAWIFCFYSGKNQFKYEKLLMFLSANLQDFLVTFTHRNLGMILTSSICHRALYLFFLTSFIDSISVSLLNWAELCFH